MEAIMRAENGDQWTKSRARGDQDGEFLWLPGN